MNKNCTNTLEPLGSKKQRHYGIDFMRGFSAYAVVLYHSGDATWGSTGADVSVLRTFFGFAVPFFLAVSFYFLVPSLLRTQQKYSDLQSLFITRARRILLPFFVWTAIYCGFKLFFFNVSAQQNRLAEITGDPLGVLLLGGASYHLYFLPLLLTGIFFAAIIRALIPAEKLSRPVVVISLLLLASLVRILVEISGNSFMLGPDVAFTNALDYENPSDIASLLRIVLVYVSWSTLLIPYLMAGILFYLILLKLKVICNGRLCLDKITDRHLGIATFLFFAATLIKMFTAHHCALLNIILAYALVFIALSLDRWMRKEWIQKTALEIGACSLGIYLIHPIVLACIKYGTQMIFPNVFNQVTIFSIFCLSLLGFIASWIIVRKLLNFPILSRLLFSR
ncbi:acyltransferase [Romeria aff. gracilis LEGE 07310]|uniref:Acyltransferase n=1 Tax=Vasconcelosia minhoensis LEGE 07310 TaxID=915328 RepID=A0A8J7ATC8_9CYAN|nr:acyltransferase [Romeria gracilis]MBE9080145.1 acyltransferase [Romeria aff. gracilis LEGE 07310]